MNRRLARLRAVQSLFQIDLTGVEWKEAIKNTLEEDEQADDFLNQVVHGVMENKEHIDETIEQHLDHWSMNRIGNVDRAALREAVYEMFYIEDIPLHVSVNEAVELAKAFGGKESGRFVNGVLSNILHDYEKKKGD